MRIENPREHGPVSEHRVLRIERRFGAQLPEPYMAFLRESNGGVPIPNGVHLLGRDWTTVHGFYGFHDGPSYLQLDMVYSDVRDRLRPGLLPIAFDCVGNDFCIDLSPRTYGQIVFWEHEDDEPLVLANDFTEFKGLLTEPPAFD